MKFMENHIYSEPLSLQSTLENRRYWNIKMHNPTPKLMGIKKYMYIIADLPKSPTLLAMVTVGFETHFGLRQRNSLIQSARVYKRALIELKTLAILESYWLHNHKL